MNTNSFIKRFSIKGLHYYRDFELVFTDPIVILVGENGSGKTTILNILYAILKTRWALLGGIGFDIIQIEFENNISIDFTHSELDGYLILKYFNKLIERNEDTLRKFSQLERQGKEIKAKFEKIEKILSEFSRNYSILYLPVVRNLKEDLRISGLDDDIRQTVERALHVEDDIYIPTDFRYLNKNRSYNSTSINLFTKNCNDYLVNTDIVWNHQKKEFSIVNKFSKELVKSHQLSSGEQQILYIFSKIHLSGSQKLLVLFDEPELSLSLAWQRKILADIVSSERCYFLLAITHSPFTFDNELVDYAKGINVCFK